MLKVRDLHAHYGKSHILQGATFDIGPGITSLLGRNGSGRSTTLKAIMGLVRPTGGTVEFNGRAIAGLQSHRIARAGIAYVPESRDIFSNLTVEENLRAGLREPESDVPRWTTAQMYDYFPRLFERRRTAAGRLSGGEQQMLTICRSLLGCPSLILIDEPTEGLAPAIVEVVVRVIKEIAERGVAVLLVEQKLSFALTISARILVMGHGAVVFSGAPGALSDEHSQIRREWIEVS